MATYTKAVFICNTYMQLLTALQLKRTFLLSVNADLILSDHSTDAKKICDRLETGKLFARICYVPTKQIEFKRDKIRAARNICELTFSSHGEIRSMLWDDMYYEKIFYYNNYDVIPLAVFIQCTKNGINPKMCCYEEGILSYETMLMMPVNHKRAIVRNLRHLLGKKDPLDDISYYFCYYPKLFPDQTKRIYKIPHLSRNEHGLVKILNNVFEYNPLVNNYSQKYIFFGSSKDIDGQPVGETELVIRLADFVGKENLLVKMHTRDSRKIYEEYGIQVSRNSSVPWEVIQLNHDFSSHVFLTVSSGSVLNASAMLGDNIPTFYLYPLLQHPERAQQNIDIQHIEPTVKKMQSMGLLTNVRIARQMEDILNA